MIDGHLGKIELNRFIEPSCHVSHVYEIGKEVKYFLKNFNAEDLFVSPKRKPTNLINNPNDVKTYKITVTLKKVQQRVVEGSYDKTGLPEDFADFAEVVLDYIRAFGLGDILNPSIYGKKRRRKIEYIFCRVTFYKGGKSYYYLTDDDSIEVGDLVVVPAGEDNHETIVEVVDIEFFTEKKHPYLYIGLNELFENIPMKI